MVEASTTHHDAFTRESVRCRRQCQATSDIKNQTASRIDIPGISVQEFTNRTSSDCNPEGGGEAVSGLTVLIH
jgi:hypothetical protein